METESKKGNWTLAIALFAVAIVLFLFLKGCDGNGETIIVKHPEVPGTTKAIKPETTEIKWPEKGQRNSVFNSNNNVKANKIDKPNGQQKDYWKAKSDSLLKENLRMQVAFAKSKIKDSLYKKAIQINAFKHTWDNDTIKATVSGLARGTVEQLKLDYTIKATSQTVKVPQTVFRLLGGIETGMTKDLSKFNAKANVGIQNKKGNILTISADSDQRFYVGYTASIFSIKR